MIRKSIGITALLIATLFSVQAKCLTGETKQAFGDTFTCKHGVFTSHSKSTLNGDMLVAAPLPEPKFWKPFKGSFAVSSAVYWTGVALDLDASRGLHGERNPLLRNSDGSTNIGTSLAISSAIYAGTLFLEKKNSKVAFFIRALAGSIRMVTAAHNYGLK